jgi:hypothetical protein
MDETTIRCYIAADGTDRVGDWLTSLSDGEKGLFAATLVALRSLKEEQWPETACKPLSRRAGSDCLGLHEVLLDGPKFCHRVLAFVGPQASTLTLMYPMDKRKSADYSAPCKTARELKKDALQNWTRCRLYLFPEDS